MRVFAAFGIVVLCAITANAQLANTTALVGNVVDPTGKSVQDAKVTAVETGTGDTRAVTTNDQGYYSFEFTRVGVYNITVEQAGFSRAVKTGIQLSVNQSVRTDFSLEIGAVTQTVMVEAVAMAIKTDDSSVSETISTRAVADLPLNGRDPMRLALTTPGVLLGPKTSDTATPPGSDFVGAGTREIQNSLALDGISVMNNLITQHSDPGDGGIGSGGGSPNRHVFGAVWSLSGCSHQHGHEVRHEPVPRCGSRVSPQSGFGRPDVFYFADTGKPDGEKAAVAAEPVRSGVRWPCQNPKAL